MTILAHEVKNLAQDRMAQGVEDLVAVLPPADDLPGTQHGQMLGRIGLLQAELPVDARDRHFALVAKQLHDGDAGRVAQSLKDARLEVTNAVLHSASPHAAPPRTAISESVRKRDRTLDFVPGKDVRRVRRSPVPFFAQTQGETYIRRFEYCQARQEAEIPGEVTGLTHRPWERTSAKPSSCSSAGRWAPVRPERRGPGGRHSGCSKPPCAS